MAENRGDTMLCRMIERLKGCKGRKGRAMMDWEMKEKDAKEAFAGAGNIPLLRCTPVRGWL